jgi:hypothetical protein
VEGGRCLLELLQSSEKVTRVEDAPATIGID